MKDFEYEYLLREILVSDNFTFEKEIQFKVRCLKEGLENVTKMGVTYNELCKEIKQTAVDIPLEDLEGFEPWDKDSFSFAIDEIEKLLIVIISDKHELEESAAKFLQNEISKIDFKKMIIRISKRFKKDGRYLNIDNDYCLWMKGLGLSLNYYNSTFEKELSKSVSAFEDTFELLFLKERVYPYLLIEILEFSELKEVTVDIKTRKRMQRANEICYGFGLKLAILEGKLRGKWPEALVIIKNLIQDNIRIKRTLNFAWGKIQSLTMLDMIKTKVKSTSDQIGELNNLKRPSAIQMDVIVNLLRTINTDFETNKKMIAKYDRISSAELESSIHNVQEKYQETCFNLANLREKHRIFDPTATNPEFTNLRKPGGNSEIVHPNLDEQALYPELNEMFLLNELQKYMDDLRNKEGENSPKIGSISNFRIVLNSYGIFERVIDWIISLSGSLKKLSFDIKNFSVSQLTTILQEILKYEDVIVTFEKDIEIHISYSEEIIEGGNLEPSALSASIKRIEIEKVLSSIVLGMLEVIDLFLDTFQAFEELSDHTIDFMNEEQVSFFENGYVGAISSLQDLQEQIKESSRLVVNPDCMIKTILRRFEYIFEFIFRVLKINEPQKLKSYLEVIKTFIQCYEKCENIIAEVESMVSDSNAEKILVDLFVEFNRVYAKLEQSKGDIIEDKDVVNPFFRNIAIDEIEDAHTYIYSYQNIFKDLNPMITKIIQGFVPKNSDIKQVEDLKKDKHEFIADFIQKYVNHLYQISNSLPSAPIDNPKNNILDKNDP